jgi:hypothetical protein
MGKVWFTFGLVPGDYHTARNVTHGMVKTLYCASAYFFSYRRLYGSRSHPSPPTESPFTPVSLFSLPYRMRKAVTSKNVPA